MPKKISGKPSEEKPAWGEGDRDTVDKMVSALWMWEFEHLTFAKVASFFQNCAPTPREPVVMIQKS